MKATYLTACQYCGAPLNPGNVERHESICPDGPQLKRAILYCLTDYDRPGYAVAHNTYMQRRARLDGLRPPAHVTLCAIYGTWAAACEHFGLCAPGRGAKAKMQKARKALSAKQQAAEDAIVAAIGAEFDAYYRQVRTSHYFRWGLLVARTTRLPDGRYAHELR